MDGAGFKRSWARTWNTELVTTCQTEMGEDYHDKLMKSSAEMNESNFVVTVKLETLQLCK